jgi:hypothetical protein
MLNNGSLTTRSRLLLIGFRKKLAKLSVLCKLKLVRNMLKKRRLGSWLRTQPKRHKSRQCIQ